MGTRARDDSADKFVWNTKADVDQATWAHFMSSFQRKLTSGDKERVYLLDPAQVASRWRTVPDHLKFPASAQTEAQIARFKVKNERRVADIESAKRDNKQLKEDCVRSLQDLCSMFTYDCDATYIATEAARAEGTALTQFSAAWKAIRDAFEPRKVLDFVRMKKDLAELSDVSMNFTRFKSEFNRLCAKLKGTDHEPSASELDLYITQGVKNPQLTAYVRKLVIDSTRERAPGEERTYTYKEFLEDATLLVADDRTIDTWRMNERPPVRGAAAKTVTPADSSTSGADVCWRCGVRGHRANRCRASTCSSCGQPVNKKSGNHWRECAGSGAPASTVPSGGVKSPSKKSPKKSSYSSMQPQQLQAEYRRIATAASARGVVLDGASEKTSANKSKKRKVPEPEVDDVSYQAYRLALAYAQRDKRAREDDGLGEED